jgi:hypothetical protein
VLSNLDESFSVSHSYLSDGLNNLNVMLIFNDRASIHCSALCYVEPNYLFFYCSNFHWMNSCMWIFGLLLKN